MSFFLRFYQILILNIWLIDVILKSATIADQSGVGSNRNEGYSTHPRSPDLKVFSSDLVLCHTKLAKFKLRRRGHITIWELEKVRKVVYKIKLLGEAWIFPGIRQKISLSSVFLHRQWIRYWFKTICRYLWMNWRWWSSYRWRDISRFFFKQILAGYRIGIQETV